MQNEWYVDIDNQRIGPIDLNTLRGWIKDGRVNINHLIWNPSFGNDWRTIPQIPELRSTPQNLPPPIPTMQPTPMQHQNPPSPQSFSPEYPSISPPQYSKPSPQPYSGGSGLGMQKIEEARRQRKKTDRIMSPLWILWPIVAYIIVFLILFIMGGLLGSMFGDETSDEPQSDEKFFDELAAAFGILILAIIIWGIILIYPWYLMIKRRTDHFQRESLLREGINEHFKEKSFQTGINLSQEIATIGSLNAEANAEEQPKSPVLYSILMIIIPYIGPLYVLYFLMKDIYIHHNRTIAVMQNTQSGANRLGLSIVAPTWKTLPSRTFILYLIISCCCPIFGLYWEYSIIKDYNEHFKAQAHFEDQLPGIY